MKERAKKKKKERNKESKKNIKGFPPNSEELLEEKGVK